MSAVEICHPERSEGSAFAPAEEQIPRCARDDKRDHTVLFKVAPQNVPVMLPCPGAEKFAVIV
jgi:hypothetical protein